MSCACAEKRLCREELAMSMWRIAIRNWVREKRGTSPRVAPHDQGYLDSLPWLTQFIPLGREVGRQKQGITFKRLNELAKLKDDFCHPGYFVDARGSAIAPAFGEGAYNCPERWAVLSQLKKLGDRARQVRFIVGVNVITEFVTIIVYKCPKDGDVVATLERLIQEEEAEEQAVSEAAALRAQAECEKTREAALQELED